MRPTINSPQHILGRMDSKLAHKIIKPANSKFAKKQKRHKVWWRVGLSALWKELCKAEKAWIRANPGDKRQQ